MLEINPEKGFKSDVFHPPNEQKSSGAGDPPARGVFATTHWSVVAAAGYNDSPRASEAMDKLCRTYWYPLYAYLRRKGYSAHDSQDLTQEFFARLLARNYLSVADRNKGKFRSFLLGSLEHFLAREWTKAHAQKRSSGKPILSLDEMDAEKRYLLEPLDELTAERIFDRRWATTVLDQAMSCLEAECAATNGGALFDKARSFLSGEKGEVSYGQVAVSLNMTEGAFKVAIHRLRQRTPEEADEELRYLFTVLRG